MCSLSKGIITLIFLYFSSAKKICIDDQILKICFLGSLSKLSNTNITFLSFKSVSISFNQFLKSLTVGSFSEIVSIFV
mgnify:CR=1 FL=1